MIANRNLLVLFLIVSLVFIPASITLADAIIADHLATGEFELIPEDVINAITNDYHIYYVHTSHGSQIVTGINLLEDENPVYTPPYFYERSDDLGHNGDTSWVAHTRQYLDAYPQCNMAMFSWCGGVSDNTEEGINIYLDKMNELEGQYPDVTFIYMTGHLDGTGPDGNLYQRNNQIRDYCVANEKVLFDFADIESYDPDGNFYPYESDACGWCYDWCETHDCPSCGCAHSQCFNCYQKGKAWWWMMASVSGWSSQIISIDMIPDDPPILVPAGGSFTYTGTLTNNTDTPQNTDVWIMLDVPNYGMYGPLKHFNEIYIEAYQTLTQAAIVQHVPGYAPTGDYDYIALCGDYPDDITDQVSFPFTVTSMIENPVRRWELNNWFTHSENNEPKDFIFVTSHPNPFNATTKINFALPQQANVKLEIFNLLGESVEMLTNRSMSQGSHSVSWDASREATGVYFYRLSIDGNTVTGRLTLLK
ncbi:MAG: T9SS type A sorting domain-containing protein [candidate division Zixibacteria bacterium]|nr:T9SS type A sorting domain-containing protein [candidate division Zixibacteria bacterium]